MIDKIYNVAHFTVLTTGYVVGFVYVLVSLFKKNYTFRKKGLIILGITFMVMVIVFIIELLIRYVF